MPWTRMAGLGSRATFPIGKRMHIRAHRFHISRRPQLARSLVEHLQTRSFIDWKKPLKNVPSVFSSLPRSPSKILESAWNDLALPKNAEKFRDFVADMRDSFEFKPGSTGAHVRDEASKNLYADKDAHVRLDTSLCEEERNFLRKRITFKRKALAQYLGIAEDSINNEDIPTIGVAGSGGGLRACIATAAYLEGMKESSLLDCTTYVAATSGSTWAQSLFYSSLGKQDPTRVLEHLKSRLGTHIAEPLPNLDILMEQRTTKYMLRGVLERWNQGFRDFGLVDLYGMLLSARLFVTKGDSILDERDLMTSQQGRYLTRGENPMPLYSVVRHHVSTEVKRKAGAKSSEHEKKDKIMSESFFQFFEFSPYEFGSEEFGAWIPTWAVGRKFEQGKSVDRTPELNLTSLLGIYSSAFCASVSHYWKEILPLTPSDVPLFQTLKQEVKTRDDQLKSIHLVDASKIPNYVKGLSDKLPKAYATEAATLELCDAGMANNLPFYPLLRRNCDIIIALDSSADVETTQWFERTEGYVKQRNIKGWPVGAGWPKADADVNSDLEHANARDQAAATDKVDEAKENRYALDGVNIWVGQSTTESNQNSEIGALEARRLTNEDIDIVSGSSGLMLIYLPLLPRADVPDADPTSTEFLSTWNFVYTPENVDSLQSLARAHLDEGAERIRRAVRGMYERKKKQRIDRERSDPATVSRAE